MNDAFRPVTPAVVEWHEDGPWAAKFEDGYFSREGAAAESDHVFIHGNDLAERFAALTPGDDFTVGETGFGTGLNLLRAARHFLSRAPAECRLHFVSVERHPLSRDDLAHALHAWTSDPLADELVAAWPSAAPGFHRLVLAQGRIRLTLMLGDAEAMFNLLDARVNAWFLDGFAPARNPDMWSEALFARLARLSASDATVATFTAAGFVRRGLQDAGFDMHRAPGFGRKREMLRGTLRAPLSDGYMPEAAQRAARRHIRHVAVIGAGLAGCTTARALAERGVQVTVFDPLGVAGAASGNLAGVVYTTPSAHPTAQNRFYQSSFVHALGWFRRHGFPHTDADGALSGVLQLPKDARQARRAREALASGLWPEDLVRSANDEADDALWFPGGGHLSPARWCEHLLDHELIRLERVRVTGLRRQGHGWALELASGGGGEFDQVVLANAASAPTLTPLPWVRAKSIRGQVSYVPSTPASSGWEHAWCHAGYLTPAINGKHCVGATFDQGDDDASARPEDDQRNLAQLEDWLPHQWQQLGGRDAKAAESRVGFRCQSRDFLPLVGPVPEEPGLWLNMAHGSRGITGTPLCAELIASEMLGEPCPVDRPMREALLPVRFREREEKNRGAGDRD